jgi:hypothetical protein
MSSRPSPTGDVRRMPLTSSEASCFASHSASVSGSVAYSAAIPTLRCSSFAPNDTPWATPMTSDAQAVRTWSRKADSRRFEIECCLVQLLRDAPHASITFLHGALATRGLVRPRSTVERILQKRVYPSHPEIVIARKARPERPPRPRVRRVSAALAQLREAADALGPNGLAARLAKLDTRTADLVEARLSNEPPTLGAWAKRWGVSTEWARLLELRATEMLEGRWTPKKRGRPRAGERPGASGESAKDGRQQARKRNARLHGAQHLLMQLSTAELLAFRLTLGARKRHVFDERFLRLTPRTMREVAEPLGVAVPVVWLVEQEICNQIEATYSPARPEPSTDTLRPEPARPAVLDKQSVSDNRPLRRVLGRYAQYVRGIRVGWPWCRASTPHDEA